MAAAVWILALMAGVAITLMSWYLMPATVTRGDRLALRKRRLTAELEPLPVRRAAFLASAGERLLAWLPAAQLERLEARLTMAGMRDGHVLVLFIVVKLVLAVVGILGGSGYGLLWVAVGGLAGFAVPDLWLSQRIRVRQGQIRLAMPDGMDMLAVSVEAGLTIDGAFQRLIAHEAPSSRALCQEVRLFLKDIQLGRSRRDAFTDLGQRSGVHDLQLFASALNQADAWGVEMAAVMRVQSDHVRTRRLQRAEELAMKAPIKMLLPLVFCIFPAIFVVLLGPAALKLTQLFPVN